MRQASGYAAFIVKLSLLIACCTNITCSLFSEKRPELTYPAVLGDFRITVGAQGEIEAKQAHTIVAPMLDWSGTQVSWLPPEGTFVKKGHLVVELEAGQIKRAYVNALNELDIAKADAEKGLAELNMEHANLESQLKSTKASLSSAKLQLDKMAFESKRIRKIRELEIAKNEVELQKIKRKLASIEKIQEEERKRLQLKVQQAEAKLQQAQVQLAQLQLKAPVDGFVQYAKLWSGDKVMRGSQLWPQMPIVKIPDLSVMQVILQVGESEAQRLQKGQKATVIIPSLDELQLTGHVSRVDKIAKAIRHNRKTTKVKRVEVAVELDSTEARVVPGLTANCRILIHELKGVITLPQECVFDKDSVKVVFVREGEDYVPHTVSVAKYGEDFVALHSDLSGGEACALREPPEGRIRWPEKLVAPAVPAAPQNQQPPDSVTSKRLSAVALEGLPTSRKNSGSK